MKRQYIVVASHESEVDDGCFLVLRVRASSRLEAENLVGRMIREIDQNDVVNMLSFDGALQITSMAQELSSNYDPEDLEEGQRKVWEELVASQQGSW
jgi:hypothetical protein